MQYKTNMQVMINDDGYRRAHDCELSCQDAAFIVSMYDNFRKTGTCNADGATITEYKRYTASGMIYEYEIKYCTDARHSVFHEYPFSEYGFIITRDQISELRQFLFETGICRICTTPVKEDAIDPYVALVKIASELYLMKENNNSYTPFSDMSGIDQLVYNIIRQIRRWRDEVFKDCDDYIPSTQDNDECDMEERDD